MTAKGLASRARILEAALALFRERGFEDTTMREVARRSGVSLGSAYYYFRSKEHLIQAFYARSHAEHLAACRPLLAGEADFERRLHTVVRTKIDTSLPYRRFAGVLFRTAADPESPLCPFSPESEPVRRQATELMAEVLEGSRLEPPSRLAAELPDLLWLYLMGVILFWIHDASAGCRRTYRLIDGTVPLVARLLRTTRSPLLAGLSERVVALLRDLRGEGSSAG